MPGNFSSLGIGGGSIKSLQRGTSASSTATIAAVNTNKAIVHFLGNNNGAAYVTLTNSTTVTISGTGGTTSWQVVEYY